MLISCHKPFSWLEIITQIVMVFEPPHSALQVPASPRLTASSAVARGWGVPDSLRTTAPPPATDAAVKSENILIIGRCYLISQFCLFSVDIVVGGGKGLRHQRLGPHRSYHSYHARHETCETLSSGHAHSEQANREHTDLTIEMLAHIFILTSLYCIGWQSIKCPLCSCWMINS